MTCKRCGGLMLAERSIWIDEIINQKRCINCANYEDETILFNRIISVLDQKERQAAIYCPRRYKYDSEGRRVA